MRKVQGDAVIRVASEDTIDALKGEASTTIVRKVPIGVAPVDCPRDCLVMYAVQPHMNALRSIGKGSWMFYYMFEILEVLKNGDRNIFPYLTAVINKMAQHTCHVKMYKGGRREEVKMCGTIYHRLTSNVYF
ncbi:hypothetical protein DPMN_109787 [Dreissena polymorpha]|uniref:Uncharacterized protein n=1 Tax=Dreissena polymorpha TaxID=45954 RepID=A0A9D4QNA0_DREPO|nr:hypothetical protein DPMN_109787 [Dreissena polymorpha]